MMMEGFFEIARDPRYSVSRDGIVIRNSYFSKRGIFRASKVMKHGLQTTGYPCVTLRGKHIAIHRLIAETFIPNPNNKKEVNHKNGIRTDFRIENLEWVTRTENQIHSWKELGRKATWQDKKGFKHHASRRVNQYDVDGNLIKIHGSMQEACRFMGVNKYTIGSSIKHRAGYFKGFNWTYAN